MDIFQLKDSLLIKMEILKLIIFNNHKSLKQSTIQMMKNNKMQKMKIMSSINI